MEIRMDDLQLHYLGELFLDNEIRERHGYSFLQFLVAFQQGRHRKLLKEGVRNGRKAENLS